MIRQATKFDRNEVTDLMLLFRKESSISHLRDIDNPTHWSRLLDVIQAGAGVIFLESGKGLVMGLIAPSVWCDKTLILNELAWYVKPEYRQTSVGYKLFRAYVEYAQELKKAGRIAAFTMAKLSSSPEFDYSRYGFSKLDETWIQ